MQIHNDQGLRFQYRHRELMISLAPRIHLFLNKLQANKLPWL